MTDKIRKGMILAAGFGTRLRPITYKTPKPLLEVGGRKIIEYNLALLGRSGISDIVINLHHLADQIRSFLGDGTRYGVKISYSYEPEILGTGGGIKKVEDFFGGSSFVVINGDVVTDVDVKDVIDFHIKEGRAATLVLRPLGRGEPYTPVLVRGGRLKGFGSGEMMYTGVQIIGPRLLEQLPRGVPSDIVTDGYAMLASQGEEIATYVHDGFWIEVGTLNCLEEARRLFEAGGVNLWYM